ncbi:MAG: MMPL family transporter, partial [Mycobacteriales bacterium]
MERVPMFAKLGRTVVRHPWWTIAAWVVIAVVLVSLAPKFKASTAQTDFLPSSYESVRAFKLAGEAFPDSKGMTSVIVVSKPDGTQLSPDDQARVAQLATTLRDAKITGVDSFADGTVSENGKVELVDVAFISKEYGDPEIKDGVEEIRSVIDRTITDSGLRVSLTGAAATGVDSEEAFSKSDQITLMATVIVIFVLLLVTFRSILAALLPLLTVGAVMAVAFALIGTVNEVFNLTADQITHSLMPIVLFGVGTDYILFLLFRYRERLRMGEDKKQAMISAVSRVGEVIASAAAVVIVAFSALVLASLGMLKSLGPATSIAVATMLLAALTLV